MEDKVMEFLGKKEAFRMGFIDWFQILLVALKLCKVIEWSWWWVLAPTWVTAIVAVVVGSIVVAVKRLREDDKDKVESKDD